MFPLRGVTNSDKTVAVRPEGIQMCAGDGRPVLLLREVGGDRGITLPINEVEAHVLAREFHGVRNGHSGVYETLEKVIAGMEGTVIALRLIGDRQRGFSGEIEVAAARRRVRVSAHPGDVVALARRLDLAVLVPAEVVFEGASVPFHAAARTAPAETGTFHPFLKQPHPEDYDW